MRCGHHVRLAERQEKASVLLYGLRCTRRMIISSTTTTSVCVTWSAHMLAKCVLFPSASGGGHLRMCRKEPAGGAAT